MPTSAARRTCLLNINCGEQLLHGARRRYAERLVEVDRLHKLLADEVIALREFAVVRERLLNAIGVAAAQRPRRMPRQQGPSDASGPYRSAMSACDRIARYC